MILAGGLVTTLAPLTISISKKLFLAYNKPVIYYSISVLLTNFFILMIN